MRGRSKNQKRRCRKLHQVLHLYGYQDMQSSTFEYFEVFRKEIGTSCGNFLTGRETCSALRPMTPSIARAAATVFEADMGNTFINHGGCGDI